MIFKTCDINQLNINEVNDDLVEFTPDTNLMFEVNPDSGVYKEPDRKDTNGTSFTYQIDFTSAKDRIVQRQFERKYRNKSLGAFVLNHNKEWKYYKSLELRSNLNSGRNNGDLNNYAYTLFSNGTERSQFAEAQIVSINLNTEWNQALDGDFTASVTAGVIGQMGFPQVG